MKIKKQDRSYVLLKVIWLDGKKEILQLPNDLQKPMHDYIEENPKDWYLLFTGGLINVPKEPYRQGYEPRMTLAHIQRACLSKKSRRKRTRGQFLTRENWRQQGVKHFFQSLRFIQHDFKTSTKFCLALDYLRWKWRARKFN